MNDSLAFYKNKRVLITGHTGFKGTWLMLFLLEIGVKSIYGLSDKNYTFYSQTIENLSTQYSSKITSVIGDITNTASLMAVIKMAEPDVIFHMAAQPLVRESYINPVITWNTNVIGTLNLLEYLRRYSKRCSVVLVTTDKVYKNNNNGIDFTEDDPLGGRDPYSASKAACEILSESYFHSFFKNDSEIRLSTARAGNVLGGGDWSKDRLIPDLVRALEAEEPVNVRNPCSVRPWQHVLDPLHGYLCLGEYLYSNQMDDGHFGINFGPDIDQIRTVQDVIEECFKSWPGSLNIIESKEIIYEAKILKLNNELALKLLNWKPKINFPTTISKTMNWYKNYKQQGMANATLDDIKHFLSTL